MHSIKSLMKRFSTIFLALAMAIGCSVSAFAAEPTDVLSAEPAAIASEADVASGEASTRSVGKQLAFAATTIYGGSGVLYVDLPSGNFWADLVAGIGYTSQTGIVKVTVTTPDGDVLELGSLSGSGSSTAAYQVFYAPAGRYAYYFSSPNNSPMEVVGYIYD